MAVGYKCSSLVADLQFQDSLKNYHLVCIITSTHGDGKVPYNAREFWQKLKHVEYELKGVKFAVFGVGDSKYEK